MAKTQEDSEKERRDVRKRDGDSPGHETEPAAACIL